MNKKVISFISHLLVFILIEILFVFVILHEFPEISLFETIGFVHTAYWIMLIIAWFIREKLKKYRQRFLATYIPVVFHIAWHIYVWISTVESIHEHHHWHEHDTVWMIIATIALWIIIFIWEWLIHKKFHCDSHHIEFHKIHCKEEQC